MTSSDHVPAAPIRRTRLPSAPAARGRTALWFWALLAAAPLSAQSLPGPTHFLWALDAGSQLSPAPLLRPYTPSGLALAEVGALPGSGQARALEASASGDLYLCRGDAVYRLDRIGSNLGLAFQPPAGAAKAQDVIQVPGSPGLFVVAWGSSAAESAVAIYDTASANPAVPVLAVAHAWDHPRRLAAAPGGNRIFVANRGTQNIVEFDPGAAAPVVTVTRDLAAAGIGPVGLCYDAANNDLWVAGDFGQTAQVGRIDLDAPGSLFSSAFTYPPSSAAGLRAPAGLYYDRFRTLYVASRGQNGGTPGVYAFSASTPSDPVQAEASYPRPGGGPVGANIIDVALQLSFQATCAPSENGEHVLAMGGPNVVEFSLPEAQSIPGAHIYFAALSFRWQSACAPAFIAGIYEPSFRLGGSDPRAIPLAQDFLFWGSVGVPVPGPSPLPPAPGFGNSLVPAFLITGFSGTLGADGTASAIVDLTQFVDPGNLFNLDGVELSLGWLTLSVTDPGFFGFVAEPLCLKLRNPAVNPVAATPCP